MIYEHCIKGRDFIVWVVDETQKKNTQINGSDEICSLINEFLSKHIKEDVLKVNISKIIILIFSILVERNPSFTFQ